VSRMMIRRAADVVLAVSVYAFYSAGVTHNSFHCSSVSAEFGN
jgi:hypothetical protein